MRNRSISTTQLAKICGVSQGTVDRALNNRDGINLQTKEKVLRVAKQYGYRPKTRIKAVKDGKSHLIGVVVFNLDNPYFSDILTRIEKLCAANGYSTVVMFTNMDKKREIECIDNLYQMNVDGIVLSPVNDDEEFGNYLSSLEIPIVTIANKLENIPFVGIDNSLAMAETVNLVIDKGYNNLIYVKPDLNNSDFSYAQKERLNSFLQIMEEKKSQYSVCESGEIESEFKPDLKNAFICANDFTAIKIFDFAKKNGAGIIGFDNVDIIDLFNLRLDSVAYDIKSTAANVMQYLINRKENKTPIKFEIIVRGSL